MNGAPVGRKRLAAEVVPLVLLREDWLEVLLLFLVAELVGDDLLYPAELFRVCDWVHLFCRLKLLQALSIIILSEGNHRTVKEQL